MGMNHENKRTTQHGHFHNRKFSGSKQPGSGKTRNDGNSNGNGNGMEMVWKCKLTCSAVVARSISALKVPVPFECYRSQDLLFHISPRFH